MHKVRIALMHHWFETARQPHWPEGKVEEVIADIQQYNPYFTNVTALDKHYGPSQPIAFSIDDAKRFALHCDYERRMSRRGEGNPLRVKTAHLKFDPALFDSYVNHVERSCATGQCLGCIKQVYQALFHHAHYYEACCRQVVQQQFPVYAQVISDARPAYYQVSEQAWEEDTRAPSISTFCRQIMYDKDLYQL